MASERLFAPGGRKVAAKIAPGSLLDAFGASKKMLDAPVGKNVFLEGVGAGSTRGDR